MQRLEWRLYEAGHCTHPERATDRDGSLRACQYPALACALHHPVHGIVLFDTGYSRHFFSATSKFPELIYRWVTPVHLQEKESLSAQLEAEGIAATRVAWVVISHLHGDHIGGVGDFRQARVACSREAWDDMQRRTRLGALSKGLLPVLMGADVQARMHWFEDLPVVALDGAFAAFGAGFDLFGDRSILLIALPGHAAGHFGLLFHDETGPVFLVADASWSSQAIRTLAPPPALVTGWLGETEVYRTTMAKLNALQQQAPSIRIVPSHCREWRPRQNSRTDA